MLRILTMVIELRILMKTLIWQFQIYNTMSLHTHYLSGECVINYEIGQALIREQNIGHQRYR